MPSSVVRLVALDHRRLERLLDRAASPGPSRDRWRREFLLLLRAHARAEQSALYDELDRDLPDAGPVDAVRAQVTAMLDLSERAEQAAVDGPAFAHLVEALRGDLAGHVHATERRLLPQVGDRLERRRLRELGGRYERSREEELEALGGNRVVPRRLDYSRAELYELARKAGIEGRSSMTREQLIDALMQRSEGVSDKPG